MKFNINKLWLFECPSFVLKKYKINEGHSNNHNLFILNFIKNHSKFDIREIIKLFKWHGKYLFHGKLRKTWNYSVLRLGQCSTIRRLHPMSNDITWYRSTTTRIFCGTRTQFAIVGLKINESTDMSKTVQLLVYLLRWRWSGILIFDWHEISKTLVTVDDRRGDLIKN